MERTAPVYADRSQAGRALAQALAHYAGRGDVIVLAQVRGGVPVAVEVARSLGAPLDLMLVRKLGVPGHEELAMGAIATGGARVLNRSVIRQLGIDTDTLDLAEDRERRELDRRARAYRGDRPEPSLRGRCVILVDDGLATGSSMAAAVEAVRQSGPARVVVAVPVAPPQTCHELGSAVEELVCPVRPMDFAGVGQWYEDFAQVSDDRVRDLLAQAWHEPPSPDRPGGHSG